MVPPVGFLRNMPYQLRLANMGTPLVQRTAPTGYASALPEHRK